MTCDEFQATRPRLLADPTAAEISAIAEHLRACDDCFERCLAQAALLDEDDKLTATAVAGYCAAKLLRQKKHDDELR